MTANKTPRDVLAERIAHWIDGPEYNFADRLIDDLDKAGFTYMPARCQTCNGELDAHCDDHGYHMGDRMSFGDTIPISAVWLRRTGDYAEVLVETGVTWRKVIEEHVEGQFSHIVEKGGIEKAPTEGRHMTTEKGTQ